MSANDNDEIRRLADGSLQWHSRGASITVEGGNGAKHTAHLGPGVCTYIPHSIDFYRGMAHAAAVVLMELDSLDTLPVNDLEHRVSARKFVDRLATDAHARIVLLTKAGGT